jgi:hypothetical protein
MDRVPQSRVFLWITWRARINRRRAAWQQRIRAGYVWCWSCRQPLNHAERSALTRVLARSNPDHNGEVSKVHLPVGGFRMRPGIEDVLQMLITDFRFDHLPDAQAAIDEGRIRWRRRQIAAMIRDDPPEAIRVLEEELGYKVTVPDGVPARSTRFDRLRSW